MSEFKDSARMSERLIELTGEQYDPFRRGPVTMAVDHHHYVRGVLMAARETVLDMPEGSAALEAIDLAIVKNAQALHDRLEYELAPTTLTTPRR